MGLRTLFWGANILLIHFPRVVSSSVDFGRASSRGERGDDHFFSFYCAICSRGVKSSRVMLKIRYKGQSQIWRGRFHLIPIVPNPRKKGPNPVLAVVEPMVGSAEKSVKRSPGGRSWFELGRNFYSCNWEFNCSSLSLACHHIASYWNWGGYRDEDWGRRSLHPWREEGALKS